MPFGLRVGDAGSKGKGLFAIRPFKKKEVVLQEDPAVAIQHIHNKPIAQVCSHCLRFVGSLEDVVARLLYVGGDYANGGGLLGIPPSILASLAQGHDSLPYCRNLMQPEVFRCDGNSCTDVYCSLECKNLANDRYHAMLCGPNLEEFYQNAAHSNDIFILAAEVIAQVATEAVKLLPLSALNAHAPEECWEKLEESWCKSPYKYAWKSVWWDCIEPPEDAEDVDLFRDELRCMALESLDLLRTGMSLWEGGNVPAAFPELFHLDLWSNIIGMFELNNLSIYVSSPSQMWLAHLHELPKEDFESLQDEYKTVMEAVDALADAGACDGNGFYSIQSCANHSCNPNTHVFKRSQDIDGRAVLIALRDISVGEEITISYINEDDEYEERQKALRDYGFVCHCDLCGAR